MTDAFWLLCFVVRVVSLVCLSVFGFVGLFDVFVCVAFVFLLIAAAVSSLCYVCACVSFCCISFFVVCFLLFVLQ